VRAKRQERHLCVCLCVCVCVCLLQVPNGLLPVIELDGRVVTESAVIMNLLEETFPDHKPLMPPPGTCRSGTEGSSSGPGWGGVGWRWWVVHSNSKSDQANVGRLGGAWRCPLVGPGSCVPQEPAWGLDTLRRCFGWRFSP
jgi:hypothetical protein